MKPHLQRAIFASQMEETSISVSTNKPLSLPSTTWTSLRNHNPLQLTSIGRVMRHKESIHLVQGPPGTGKSSTIVGLVTALVSLLCCSNGLFISISKVISYYLTSTFFHSPFSSFLGRWGKQRLHVGQWYQSHQRHQVPLEVKLLSIAF